jgi:hypothetical protein
MSWVRYDDQFYSHPKVISARARDVASIALHVLANTWSETTKQPGFVPVDAPEFLIGNRQRGRRLAKILEDVGLWDAVDGGWMFHDKADYSAPSVRSEAEAVGGQESLSDKRRRAAKASWERRRQGAQDTANRDAHAMQTDASAQASAMQTDASAMHPVPGLEALASEELRSSKQSAPPEPAPDGGARARRTGAKTPNLAGHGDGRTRIIDVGTSAVLEEPPRASHIGNELLREHLSSYAYTQPTEVQRWSGRAIDRALADGTDPRHIQDGLRMLREAQSAGDDVGPGLLPKFIDRAIRGVGPGTSARRASRQSRGDRQADAIAALKAELAGEQPARQTSFFPHVIEGETA